MYNFQEKPNTISFDVHFFFKKNYYEFVWRTIIFKNPNTISFDVLFLRKI